MCEAAHAVEVERRLVALERFVAEYVMHDLIDHAHVHDGYVTTAQLRAAVDSCLAEAAAEIEAETKKEEPPDEPKEEPVATEEKPKTEEKKDEPGPTTQGRPVREHGLHRRVGGRRAV